MPMIRFFLLVALLALLPTTNGLAFVASSMRTFTKGGPFAALEMRSQVAPKPPSPMTVDEQNEDGTSPDKSISSVQAMRDEMRDIVYQRSLQRLDSFDDQ